MKILRGGKFFGFLLAGLIPALTFAANNDSIDHQDPVAAVILWVTLIFFFALIGRYFALKCKQPAVLGELLMGVFVGNIFYLLGSDLIVILREGSAIFTIMRDILSGDTLSQAINANISNPYYALQVNKALSTNDSIDYIKVAYILDIFSRYGVIFLLFKVGLESSIEELKHTGRQALQVAFIGVAAPLILGYFISCLVMPMASYSSHLFVAATLCATSIGITARVLTEMKKIRTREAKTILGAAMIDDILGLIILAIVSSMVTSGVVNLMITVKIIFLALAFFAGALTIGPWLLRKAVHYFQFLSPWELKLSIAFIFVMSLAWLATEVHLAAIIGAFSAGLILHDNYFLSAEKNSKSVSQSIEALIAPIESILAPLFFILIGIQVKLESFFDWQVLFMASGLIIAAILGKLISGLGGSAKDDRLLIGIGMLPRGEVGLVFASIGRTLGVMSDQIFSAIVLMVIVTTFIAPPLLKARYAKTSPGVKV